MLGTFVCSALAAPPGSPSHLRVNDVANPVGTSGNVYFGWRVNDPDPNEIQSAYQLLVASSPTKLASGEGDIWDSGKTTSRLQNHVTFGGSALASDRKYHWKLRTWDKNGNEGPWSESATFTVGPLSNADWSGAHWIKRDNSDMDDYTYYRKSCQLPDKAVERANVYIAANHKYSLFINGILVGKGPAYQHPQYQYYNAYDVTALMKANAANQFAIFHHWFGGGQGRPAGSRGVILKVVIHHVDGTKTEIVTDGTWRQARAEAWIAGQPQRNRGEGVGFVERIDARQEMQKWFAPSFDDSSWKPVTMIGSQPTAPWTGTLASDLTRIEETMIAPASIIHQGDGRYVIDLGKVYSGMPRIRFSGGAAGTVVNMRGGYALSSSGEIDTDSNQVTDLSDQAVLDGGEFVFEPFEYMGMRYFQIDNSPMAVTESNFSFVVRHSAMDGGASSFASSDETLNAVWELMKHSLFTCAQEDFVDTPTREKGGFLGDAAIQSTVAMPVLNERAMTQRVLREFLQSMEQHWNKPTDRGRMNAVYPNNDGARDIPDFTQAYLPWVWTYYMETGDRDFLEANYSKLCDIADYVHRHIDPVTGLITKLTGGSGPYEFGIIDWPAPMRFGYDMNTSARTVINGWAYADFDAQANIAHVLGNTSDREKYANLAETLKSAINQRLINEIGVYVDGLVSPEKPSAHVSQHANMFPLALGIVPHEHRTAVISKVKELRMSVGMVTVMWLIRALGEADQGPHLIELLTNPDWPGWARCLSRGATATWESWNSDVNAHESQSHAWGAAGLEAYSRYILGIQPLEPQYQELLIKPLDFGNRLDWAKGTIATDRGPVAVDWRRGERTYEIRVELPVNVTAKIAIPRGSAANPSVLLNGVETKASIEGNYLVIDGIGSGAHTISRSDS